MADDIPNPAPPANFPKQAVVVIHGMGEQIPMDTITAFVRAAWEKDDHVHCKSVQTPAEVWSKPDGKTGSSELRRITTRQTKDSGAFPRGVRTDFYELYWADQSFSPTLALVWTWLKGLLLRNPATHVPRKLRVAWLALWVVSLAVIYLAAAPVVKPDDCLFSVCPYGWVNLLGWLKSAWPWISLALAAGVAYFESNYLVPYCGRVVRYISATPDNVAARKAIRERGMALLDALHDGTYDRIILVGHSLGSILGYDLLNYYWAARPQSHTFVLGSAEFSLLIEIEEAVAALRTHNGEKEIARFHKAQRALRNALRTRPKPKKGSPPDPKADTRWLITDFVTLGSPLTHSEVLLTNDMVGFREKIVSRQYPVCPPVREVLDTEHLEAADKAGFELEADRPRLMSFPYTDKQQTCWQLHHAAPFSVVRWTNLHDPACFVICGDLVSGPVGGNLYGQGVVDIDLSEINGGKQSWWFTHTNYWRLGKNNTSPPRVLALRQALDLAGETL